MTDTPLTIDVGYYPDFNLRMARSAGYSAGYDGLPRERHLRDGSVCRYQGAELAAWNEGWDAGARIRETFTPTAKEVAPAIRSQVAGTTPATPVKRVGLF